MKTVRKSEEEAENRFTMIAPLLDETLDRAARSVKAGEIAERNGISQRSISRYVKSYQENGFEGLKSKPPLRPETVCAVSPYILSEAITLRKEVPGRSVKDIIKILELEGKIEPGTVLRSSLQRHMHKAGFGAKQVAMYTKKGTASRRFAKEHRCELWQSDIKYGPFLPIGKNGTKKQIYLITWIDDATRHIMAAQFYDNQRVEIVEDSLRRAIMQYGRPDSIYVDNGKQYRSNWLKRACAKIGIRYLTAKPYHPEGKGKVEFFNKRIKSFISEAALSDAKTLEEYNHLLNVWIEEHYHCEIHSELKTSPKAAFISDSRTLSFVDGEVLREAFLHTEDREVDKTGVISFEGEKYEVGLAYIGRKVDVYYDPSWTDEVEIHAGGTDPFMAKRLVIGRNCGIRRDIPDTLKAEVPGNSRFLDALEKKHAESVRNNPIATIFKDIRLEDS
jgi:transposase InsO family protein